jgi:hypothetical protein
MLFSIIKSGIIRWDGQVEWGKPRNIYLVFIWKDYRKSVGERCVNLRIILKSIVNK